MEKIAVYTGIFGRYDPYVEPDFGDDVDLFLLTDFPLGRAPRRTKVITIPSFFQAQDTTRTARLHKVMSHIGPVKDYRLVVWLDGSVDAIDVDLRELVERYLSDSDVAVFRHQTIDCVYEGARAAVACGKEDPAVMGKELKILLGAGHPRAAGLGETGILLRRHSDVIRSFNELWWSKISAGSKRDQVYFNYCVGQAGVKLAYIDGKRQDYGFYVREHAGLKVY